MTDEQQRLLRWLESGGGSQSKTSVTASFSAATIRSLLAKKLIRDDWAKGYYTIADIG